MRRLLPVVLSALACGAEPELPPAPPAPQPARETAPPSPAPAAPGPDAPLPGELSIALEADRVSLRAGGVPLNELMTALAAQGEFPLRGQAPSRPVTLVRIDAPLAAVLAELLRGVPYAARWAPVEAPGPPRHRLTSLDVGAAPLTGLSHPVERENPSAAAREAAAQQEEERRQEEEARRSGPPPVPLPVKTNGQLIDQLESRDPEDRMEAIVDMDTSGWGLDLVIAAVEDDDPEVRISALERLAEDETLRATAALVGALRSEHPEVLVRSLELLAFVGDESIVDAIEPLQFHADPDVRDAAEEALADLDLGAPDEE